MDKDFKWEPWENNAKNKNYRPDIIEPPCKNCTHWWPHDIFKKNGDYDGIICCTEKKMYADFSCFEKKK